jgi:hypothetical protein
MNNILRPTGRYAGFALLIFIVCLCRNSLASIDSIVSEKVKIDGDCISVQAKEITLGKLLEAIEKSTGIRFKLNKSLSEKEISVDFTELSLLKGIKKIIYPLNYSIIYAQGGKIRKVIIIDQINASTVVAFNEKSEGFFVDSQDVPPFENKQIAGEGRKHSPPGSELTLIGGPPGTNILVQGPPDSKIGLKEGPPGTDVFETQAPPGE